MSARPRLRFSAGGWSVYNSGCTAGHHPCQRRISAVPGQYRRMIHRRHVLGVPPFLFFGVSLSNRCIVISIRQGNTKPPTGRTDTMKTTTIKDNITTYLLRTIGKDVDLEDWFNEHKVNVDEATETVADYMREHDVDFQDIDPETLEDMLGAE